MGLELSFSCEHDTRQNFHWWESSEVGVRSSTLKVDARFRSIVCEEMIPGLSLLSDS